MPHGLEGGRLIHRGAETAMISKESRGRTPESLIETQRRLASKMVQDSRIVTVLRGEESTPFIANNRDPQRQLDLAQTLLLSAPFLKKYMPQDLDEMEQAAFIVGLAEAMEQEKQTLN